MEQNSKYTIATPIPTTGRSKVIFYSEKSETDDNDAMMGDTPSNYDLQNCRMTTSKLPNLKSILTQAKNIGGSSIASPSGTSITSIGYYSRINSPTSPINFALPPILTKKMDSKPSIFSSKKCS